MSDYIKREDAIEAADKYLDSKANGADVASDLISDITCIPAAPMREVVPGHWLWDKVTRTCNQCGQMRATDKRDNFCPNCGADMRREAEQDG